MKNNPYAENRWPEDELVRATMSLAHEQHIRNRIAYLTLTNRVWYDGDEELDEYFGE